MSSPSADPHRGGSLRRTTAAALVAFALAALIVGWVIHYVAQVNTGLDPSLNWSAAGVVAFLAAFVAVAAFRTRQAMRAKIRLPVHRAVNLLVLGKACARAGAAVLGGYAGFAVGYLRPSMSVAGAQLVIVALTCASGVALMIAGLALERACEVPPDDTEEPL